jgi:hypothetical protein
LMVPQRFFTHGQRSTGDRAFTHNAHASFLIRCWTISRAAKMRRMWS